MKQIEVMINMIAKIVFKKDIISYEIINKETNISTDLLHKELIELLNSNKINEAEDLLFDSIKTNDIRYLEVAVDFYNRLNKLSDEKLEECNFSRDEIESGLKEISEMFGLMF